MNYSRPSSNNDGDINNINNTSAYSNSNQLPVYPSSTNPNKRYHLEEEEQQKQQQKYLNMQNSFSQLDTSALPPPYKVIIRQEPVHARMSGFGFKDYRTIDPVPVLQLFVYDHQTQTYVTPKDPDFITNFICHATLYTQDQKTAIPVVVNRGHSKDRSDKDGYIIPFVEILCGTTIVAADLFQDVDGTVSTLFPFIDLCIRTAGKYTIRFDVYNLLDEPFSKSLCYAHSEVLNVYTPIMFPKILDASDLSKALANQGLKIFIRPTNSTLRSSHHEPQPQHQHDNHHEHEYNHNHYEHS